MKGFGALILLLLTFLSAFDLPAVPPTWIGINPLAAVALVPWPKEAAFSGGDVVAAKPAYETDASLPAEGYRLSVTDAGVRIWSSTDAGRFYAEQTLKQLVEKGRCPKCEIADAPAYPWRGFLVNESTGVFGVPALKRLIDQMAAHKYNVFHWHLSDDEGWRIDLKKFPELTKYGAVRPSSPIRGAWRKGQDGVPYGIRAYTEEEVREIVGYAAARHVTVVPEIDFPGHCRPFVAAYPEFRCTSVDAKEPRTPSCAPWLAQGRSLCPSATGCVARVLEIYTEVAKLFPGPYVHIGGDEVAYDRWWAKCDRCKAQMKALGYDKPQKLHADFVRRIAAHVASLGKIPTGWNEILGAGTLPTNVLVMAWTGHAAGVRAVDAGHDALVMPENETYLNIWPGWKGDPQEYCWRHPHEVNTCDRMYAFDPARDVSGAKRNRIRGSETCFWGVLHPEDATAASLDWFVWPRAACIAEALWTAPATRDWKTAEPRFLAHRECLVRQGVNAQPVIVSDREGFGHPVWANGAATDADLKALVAEDVAKPVRTPAANGGKFWNMNSMQFMYPPAFDLPAYKDAAKYRYHIFATGRSYTFDDSSPRLSLERVWLWKNLPAGRVTVVREAINRWQFPFRRDERTFWKSSPYEPGAYPKPPRTVREAVRLGYDYIWRMPSVRYFAEHGKPDPGYKLNCYPAKMHSALIRAYLRYAELNPSDRAAALKLASATADWLISVSMPEGTPLAGFAPTYAGTYATAGMYHGINMLSYPAEVGLAYLKLEQATGEAKYRAAAVRVAARYLALQGADGTWYLKLREKDGRPENPNRLLPDTVIDFLDACAAATGEAKYRAAADRAFAYLENGPMKDWNWEGQFEDAHPAAPYENLTKHPACATAQLILARKPYSADDLYAARELLRWSEDQFVCWRQPGAADRLPLYGRRFTEWVVEPSVLEQYFYRVPVDASVARLVNTYLALYRAAENPLDLAKARTLGDALVRAQRADGSIPTLWPKGGDSLWINCMILSLEALENLADVEEKQVREMK